MYEYAYTCTPIYPNTNIHACTICIPTQTKTIYNLNRFNVYIYICI